LIGSKIIDLGWPWTAGVGPL